MTFSGNRAEPSEERVRRAMKSKYFCFFEMRPNGEVRPVSEGDTWSKEGCLPLFEVEAKAKEMAPQLAQCWLDEIELKEALDFVAAGHADGLRIYTEDQTSYVVNSLSVREMLRNMP